MPLTDRFALFPVYAPTESGACGCGKEGCDRAGKHPMYSWSRLGIGEKVRGPDGCNYGIATGERSGIVVVDIDKKPGVDLSAMLARFPDTYTVQTPTGGFHLYYEHPGWRVKTSAGEFAPGVDIRADGGYAAAVGSRGRNGHMYAVTRDMPIAPFPEVLEAWDGIVPRAAASLGSSPVARGQDSADWDFRWREATKHCQTCVAIAPGDGGAALFVVAQVLVRTYELPLDAAMALLVQVWNPRVLDADGNPYPWDEDDFVRKLEQARDVGTFRVGCAPEGMQDLGAVALQVLVERSMIEVGLPPTDRPPKVFQTESGNAELYHFFNRNRMLYVQTLGWLSWDGSRWAEDPEGLSALRATGVVVSWLHENHGGTVENHEAAFKWAVKTEERKGRNSMVALAKTCYLPVQFEDLDADPWLFNVANGVLDLRTAELLPPSPERLITKQSPIVFDPDAQCPLWRRFLHRIFDGDVELVSYMQRLAGYCLTGSVEEQMLSFFYGNGSNGKSTLTVVLQKLLGEYACSSPSTLLLARSNDQHPTAFADLRGIRLTVCQETEQGKAWDESLVKQLTGDDIIRARRMHKDFFEFRPSHKIVMSGNHKPTVKGVDHGIWRRVRLVPFAATIGDGEKDKKLMLKLMAELPGILNWALEGCLLWQTHGLGTCAAVDAGTQEYREEEDVIGQFFETSAMLAPEALTARRDLYRAYDNWSRGQGEIPMSTKGFTQKMVAKGFKMKKVQGERYWIGVGLKDALAALQGMN